MTSTEVIPGLVVGDISACSHGDSATAVVHACKHPCHQDAVGYSGSLPQSHDEYLVAPRGRDLYLNLVDMDRPLSHEYTEPIMTSALDFIEAHLDDHRVVIHCNEGRSRSPSIALLYLAKRAGEISDGSFDEATEAFAELYPGYAPGRGIRVYLERRWDDIS